LYHTKVSLFQGLNSKLIKRSETGQAPLGSPYLHSQRNNRPYKRQLRLKKMGLV